MSVGSVLSSASRVPMPVTVPVTVGGGNTQNPLSINSQNLSVSSATPDDSVGDIMPLGVFALTQGSNTLSEVEKISQILNRIPSVHSIQTGHLKIKTVNKIPTGIITT